MNISEYARGHRNASFGCAFLAVTLVVACEGTTPPVTETHVGPPVALRFVNGGVGDTITGVPAGVIGPVRVEIVDADLHRVVNAQASVTVSLSPDSLLGTRTASTVDGVAVFPDLAIHLARNYTMTASATDLAPASSRFAIVAGPVTHLAFAVDARDGRVSVKLPGIYLNELDAYGNVRLTPPFDFQDTAVIEFGQNPGGATLSGQTNTFFFNGLSFDYLFIDKPGTGYTFVIHHPRHGTITTAPFNVK